MIFSVSKNNLTSGSETYQNIVLFLFNQIIYMFFFVFWHGPAWRDIWEVWRLLLHRYRHLWWLWPLWSAWSHPGWWWGPTLPPCNAWSTQCYAWNGWTHPAGRHDARPRSSIPDSQGRQYSPVVDHHGGLNSLSMDNPSWERWDMTVPAVRGCPRHSGGAVGTINIVTNDPEATRAPEIPLRPKNKKTHKILDIIWLKKNETILTRPTNVRALLPLIFRKYDPHKWVFSPWTHHAQ